MGALQSVCYSDQTVENGQLPKQTNIIKNLDVPYKSQVSRSKINFNQSRIIKQAQYNTIKKQLLPYFESLNVNQALKIQVYRNFTEFEITNELNHREIQISRGAKILNHKKIAVNMGQFLKYNWESVQKIEFTKCQIDDAQWRLFVSKAHLFPNLKILRLDENKISEVKKGDLEGFVSLRNVSFGDYDSIANPLTRQSKKYLCKFEKNHGNPKFWLEYVPQ